MAYNYLQAMTRLGDIFAEGGLRYISEMIAQGTDGNMVIFHHSRDDTEGTDTMSFRHVLTMNCFGLLQLTESLCNALEEFLQTTDEPTDGKTYIMYHGTTYDAAQSIIRNGFRQSSDGMLGRGVYISRDKDKALRYPLFKRSDQVVLKLRVNVGKVIKIDRQNHPLQKTWHDHGYDTAWVPPYCGMVKSGLQEDCVWDTKRIQVVGVAYATDTHVKQFLDNLVEQYAQ